MHDHEDHTDPKSTRRPGRRWRRVWIVLAIMVIATVAVRLALPHAARWYVNRALEQSEIYQGVVGDVRVHLWRGAYSIDDIRMLKTTGNVAVPFFAAKRVEFAVKWRALWNGELVGRLALDEPELNFVAAEDAAGTQAGDGAPWLRIVSDLFPFAIDSAEIHNGHVAFRAFHTEPPVDVYLSQVEGTVRNLTNIHRDVTPLFARVEAHALAMDGADLEVDALIDPLAYRPTFRLALRLLGLDVRKLNALAVAYGKFDLEHGWFDLVVQLDAKHGQVDGYIKPVFTNLRVFDVRDDIEVNLLATFWEALVGVGGALFKNQPHDRLATVIPLSGDLTGVKADLLATIGNLLRNAFVRAYLPQFQGTASDRQMLTFGPGELIDSDATRDVPAPGGDAAQSTNRTSRRP